VSSIFTAIQWPFGIAVGTGVGAAAAGAITPVIQDVVNEAWETHPVKPPPAGLLATGVAQGQISESGARAWAKQTGFDSDQFDAMIAIADTGPGIPRAFEMWHRGIISEADFRVACKREALEERWTDGLVALHDVILSPAEAAAAWQQGYMSETEASDEAELAGVTPERSQIQRNLAGLPPGPETGLAMLRRGITDDDGFTQMIVEGNTKRKYADEYLELRWNLLTASQWATAWLKGHATEAEAKAGGAAVGYDADAMDLLYLNQGRPATTRQIHIGYARGAELPGVANEEEAIRTAVRQSNIRTEYADLLVAQRYTYPSAFVLRALAADGTFSQQETETILVESGWRPEWAQAAAAKWSGAGETGTGGKWADRARGRLFTSTHDEYLEFSIAEAQARANLARIGAAGGEVDTIITLWNVERATDRRRFTAAQVRAVWKKGNMTEPEALDYLDALGYSAEDGRDWLAS
jgi:hypothetical protein